ncbi:hypothetical protein A3K72_00910 [Candidatus Woesearchaeota archaeon RBG_13_36_6]|nr:MAG: hypothetical protein A3K72_00910 [Candidatus Woesearchaeota archaeon RBG_13_36_6]
MIDPSGLDELTKGALVAGGITMISFLCAAGYALKQAIETQDAWEQERLEELAQKRDMVVLSSSDWEVILRKAEDISSELNLYRVLYSASTDLLLDVLVRTKEPSFSYNNKYDT